MIDLILGDCLSEFVHAGCGYRCIITDPPYSRSGATITGRSSGHGTAQDSVQSDIFWSHWFTDVWRQAASICEKDACALVFCDWRTVNALERAVMNARNGWRVSQVAVWDRDSIGMGSPMRAQHELIAFVRGPRYKWTGPRDIGNVFRERFPYGRHKNHSAEKPVSLLRRLVNLFSQDGPVLDPFAGSGSTLMACHLEGVDAVGIEIDKDTAIAASERLNIRLRLLDQTVLRRASNGQMFLMNRRDRGWAEYSIPIRNEDELEVLFYAKAGEWKVDEHSDYADVVPWEVQDD